MSEKSNSTAVSPYATRRRVLGAVGAVGTTAIAGCASNGGEGDGNGGDGNGGDGNGDGGTGDQRVDQTFRYIVETLPTEQQLNPYNPNNVGGDIGMVFNDMGYWSPMEGEWVGAIASDWSVDGEEISITLNEDHQWHDGSELTADDVVRKTRFEKHFEAQFWEWMESVEATDEKTVLYSLDRSVSQDIIFSLLFDEFQIDTPESQYQSYLESLEDASNDDAEQSALSDLTSFAPGYGDAIGNSLFSVENVDSNRVAFTTWEGHPSYDDINFTGGELTYISSENKVTALINDQVDSINADTVGPGTRGQVENSNAELRFVPGTGGVSWSLDLNHDLLGRRKVRQALAYILDGNEILANPLRGTGATEIPCGLPVNLEGNKANLENWLPNLGDQLTRYGRTEENLSRAESLLREEGFSKDGDQWMTPNGEAFTVAGPWPSAGPNPSRVQVMNRQLEDFGINGSIQVIETSTWGSRLTQCDYDITHGSWGGNNPYQAFQAGFISAANPRPSPQCEGELKTSFEVPWPAGEPDGEVQSVNWQDRFNQLLTASGEEATQLTEELAWIFNQALPQIPVLETNTPYAIRTDDWNWPESGDSVWGYSAPPTITVNMGHVTAKTN
jgi:peptide/nickel transport system substrate-binding protein